MNEKLLKLIKENAKSLVSLNNSIKNGYERKNKTPEDKIEWEQACSQFHSSYDQLAFPGGLEEGMALLKNGDVAAVEKAIAFLEVDPFFHSSGYIKEKILRYLVRADLTVKQLKLLQRILLRHLQETERREFRSYCKLAKKIADDSLIKTFDENLLSVDPGVVRRAKYMLDSIKSL